MVKTILLVAVVALLCGCDVRDSIESPQHETKVVELDKSEMVRVDLKMGAGELRVEGGSAKLMEADFNYNLPGWKPQVEYHSTGVRSDLEVTTSGDGGSHGKHPLGPALERPRSDGRERPPGRG